MVQYSVSALHSALRYQASWLCRYAWECQTQEGGWGLDGILREQSWKLRGIVNGIDYSEWSPQVCISVCSGIRNGMLVHS